MHKSIFSLAIICTLGMFVLLGSIFISNTLASSISNEQTQSLGVSSSQDSAVEKLAQALQKDKDEGNENGGENWDRAIDSLSTEMGIPVDDDIEDALLKITETHINNISNN
jgi:uncharacterized FlaG/YvyC family protein